MAKETVKSVSGRYEDDALIEPVTVPFTEYASVP
jgi:hypothetical protein